MSEPPAIVQQSVVTVSGRDPLRLVQSLVVTLGTLTSDQDSREDNAESVAVALFQAEGTSIPDLVQRIVDDVLAVIADSASNVADIELANVLRTDQGWRAWGNVRFNSARRRGAPPAIVVDSSDVAAAGPIAIRLMVTPDASAAASAGGSPSSASDGEPR